MTTITRDMAVSRATPPPRGGNANTAPALLLVMVMLATLGLLVNSSKGVIESVQVWGLPYWYLDYGDGFIRRGAAGTLFQLLVPGSTPEDLASPIRAAHALVTLSLAGTALAAVHGALRQGRHALLVTAIGSWFLAAQLWPTLAYNVGYLDPFLLLLATAVALLLRAGRNAVAGVFAAAAPLVHEYFVFLLPFVVAAAVLKTPGPIIRLRGSVAAPPLLVCAATLMSSIGVTFFADRSATSRQVMAMPIPDEQKKILLDATLSQQLGDAFAVMRGLLAEDVSYTAFNLAFFGLPTLLCCAASIYLLRQDRARALLVGAGAVAPLASLALAWDLSRLVVLSNFTAGMLFLWTVQGTRSASGPGPSRQLLKGACIVAALVAGF